MAKLVVVLVLCFALTTYGAPVEDESTVAPVDDSTPITLIGILPDATKNITIGNTTTLVDDEERILKGARAANGQWPFIVSLQIMPQPGMVAKFCGGSIITDSHILTAAHCFSPLPEAEVMINAGTTEAFNFGGQSQQRKVVKIIRHPGYDAAQSHLNDICVLVLDRPLKMGPTVRPVSLAPKGFDPLKIGAGRIAGWGATHGVKHDVSSVSLLEVPINVVTPQYCAKHHPVHTGVLCIENSDNSGPCSGDSGGPFVQYYDNKMILVGLTSYGLPQCGIAPTVYTRVSEYLDFVDQAVKGMIPGASMSGGFPQMQGGFPQMPQGFPAGPSLLPPMYPQQINHPFPQFYKNEQTAQ